MENNIKLLVFQGIPASGKSTAAREFMKGKTDWVCVNRDAIRLMRGDYWIPNQESLIAKMESNLVDLALSQGFNVLIDATNLNQEMITKWKHTALTYNAEIEFQLFDVPLEVAIERDSKRERKIGAGIITSFYNRYIKKED